MVAGHGHVAVRIKCAPNDIARARMVDIQATVSVLQPKSQWACKDFDKAEAISLIIAPLSSMLEGV